MIQSVCVFDSKDESLVVDRVYRFYDCPPSRVDLFIPDMKDLVFFMIIEVY